MTGGVPACDGFKGYVPLLKDYGAGLAGTSNGVPGPWNEIHGVCSAVIPRYVTGGIRIADGKTLARTARSCSVF